MRFLAYTSGQQDNHTFPPGFAGSLSSGQWVSAGCHPFGLHVLDQTILESLSPLPRRREKKKLYSVRIVTL